LLLSVSGWYGDWFDLKVNESRFPRLLCLKECVLELSCGDAPTHSPARFCHLAIANILQFHAEGLQPPSSHGAFFHRVSPVIHEYKGNGKLEFNTGCELPHEHGETTISYEAKHLSIGAGKFGGNACSQGKPHAPPAAGNKDRLAFALEKAVKPQNVIANIKAEYGLRACVFG
jgi:hypothetical protein